MEMFGLTRASNQERKFESRFKKKRKKSFIGPKHGEKFETRDFPDEMWVAVTEKSYDCGIVTRLVNINQ